MFKIGPLMKSPIECQMLFLDCLHDIPGNQPMFSFSSLEFVLQTKAYSQTFVSKLLFVLEHHFQSSEMTEENQIYLHSLIKILVVDKTRSQRDPVEEEKRYSAMKSAAIRFMLYVVPKPKILTTELMNWILESDPSEDESKSAIHGVLSLALHVLSDPKSRMGDKENALFQEKVAALMLSYFHQAFDLNKTDVDATKAVQAPLNVICNICWKYSSLLKRFLTQIQKKPNEEEKGERIVILLLALLEDLDLKEILLEAENEIKNIFQNLQLLQIKTERFERLKALMKLKFNPADEGPL